MSTSGQVRPGAEGCSRAQVAEVWSKRVRSTAVVTISDDEIDHVVRDLLDHLVDALAARTFSPHPAAGVGAQLAQQGFIGEHSLGHTMEILGHGLPAIAELSSVEGLKSKVISLLGALASGYTAALRRRILDQQENVKHALLRARLVAEQEHLASEARFRAVFDAAPLGMVISALDGRITQANGMLANILGYPPAELTGREIRQLCHPDDAAGLSAAYQRLTAGLKADFPRRVKLCNAQGDTRWVSLAVSILRDAQGSARHHVTMVEDVTDTHLLEQRLQHQTLHDVLTGLPNQEYFWINLRTVLERAEPGATVTLLKIDLDGFAVVNIGHGHDAGNLVLQETARRLQTLVARERAMVARFGADEFAILIEDSPTTPAVTALAEAINSELSEPVYLQDDGLAVSAGIGVVRRPAHGITATELVRAADAALHRAKRTGRGQWEPDDSTADAKDRARYMLACAMPGAWENGEVTLCYQPVVRLDPAADDAGRIVAVQALLQWHHPEHGLIAPLDCAALAERTGLVVSLGPWMLHQACRQLRVWRDQLAATQADIHQTDTDRIGMGRTEVTVPPVRVDLTTHLACDPDLMAVLRSALDSCGLGPQDLQLGIPVELVVAGRGDTQENLRVLADAAIWTALTRYGQSVGNLIVLENHPVCAVDVISEVVCVAAQLSGSLIRQAVGALVPLIRRTGTAVVVAGVDSPEQTEWWRRIGADSARGAAFAPPVAPEHIPALLGKDTDKAGGDH